MKIEQTRWTAAKGWEPAQPGKLGESAQLVFVFASTNVLKNNQIIGDLKKAYKKAHILGCSTAGEIYGTSVSDDSLVATAVVFEQSQVQVGRTKISNIEDSFHAGERLGQTIDKNKLVHLFVLSDGLNVNGSELVRGLTKYLPREATVTGGLSGDGDRFAETLVLLDDKAEANTIAALGLYGDHLRIGYGSLGGWDTFGPERLITKSKGNVLFELDGKSALDLYKKYLGDHAKGLPATGLLFPLCLTTPDNPNGLVRTILSVDEKEKSMTFAGDIPEGSYAKLMKANFDRLVDGAMGAAKTCHEALNSEAAELAVLISCVGRKLILKQRIEEEVEAVRNVLGKNATLTGFYSYGEIAPFMPNAKCELHNQTMTITTFSEKKAA